MLTAKALQAHGLDASTASAVANATAHLTGLQWWQLLQSIIAALGPIIGGLFGGGGIGGGTPARP